MVVLFFRQDLHECFWSGNASLATSWRASKRIPCKIKGPSLALSAKVDASVREADGNVELPVPVTLWVSSAESVNFDKGAKADDSGANFPMGLRLMVSAGLSVDLNLALSINTDCDGTDCE
jgi:hypothetical protein